MRSLYGMLSTLVGLRLSKSLNSLRSRTLRNSRRGFSSHNRRLVRPVSIASKMEATSGLDNDGGSSAARVSTMSNGGEDGDRVVHFPLSPSSTFKIQKGDITQWFVDGSSDAVVNPANERMLGGGGADGAIHRAAGPELRAACYKVPDVQRGVRCPVGEARITPGFRLPVSHVIHTVGPIYYFDANPGASLRNAYRNSLRVAKENNIQYIAFPAISCGVYGYPFDEAATIAISTVREFANELKESFSRVACGFVATLAELLMDIRAFAGVQFSGGSRNSGKVHFVLFADDVYDVWLNKANELLQDH